MIFKDIFLYLLAVVIGLAVLVSILYLCWRLLKKCCHSEELDYSRIIRYGDPTPLEFSHEALAYLPPIAPFQLSTPCCDEASDIEGNILHHKSSKYHRSKSFHMRESEEPSFSPYRNCNSLDVYKKGFPDTHHTIYEDGASLNVLMDSLNMSTLELDWEKDETEPKDRMITAGIKTLKH